MSLAALAASPVQAALVWYRIPFIQSTSSEVTGYRLELRDVEFDSLYTIDIGTDFEGPDGSGVSSFSGPLDDARAWELTLFAYDAAGRSSPPSNTITVLAAVTCAADADCSDGDLCTGTESCVSGRCQSGAPPTCDVTHQCRVGTCDAIAGCGQSSLPNGTPCDDGNPATADDACIFGFCMGTPVAPACSSSDECADGDFCNGAEQCVNGSCLAGAPPSCGISSQCRLGSCDEKLGCVILDLEDGTPCNDGDGSTPVDFCVAGTCRGFECAADVDCGSGRRCLAAQCISPDPIPNAGVSIDLDGSGEYLASHTAQRLGFGTEFSISIWLKPYLLGNRQLLNLHGGGASAANAVAIELSGPGGPIRVSLWDALARYTGVEEFEGYAAIGEWLHLVITHRDAGSSALTTYVNGVAVGPDRILASGPGRMSNTPRQIVMGAAVDGTSGHFSGRIGHVAMWSRELTGAEVDEIWASHHEIDLRTPFGAYASSDDLVHYWRPGGDLANIGRDFADERIDLPDGVGIDANDVVPDAPGSTGPGPIDPPPIPPPGGEIP